MKRFQRLAVLILTALSGVGMPVAQGASANSDLARASGFYDRGLPHLAFDALAQIAAQAPSPERANSQIAALALMNKIQSESPALATPASVRARLAELARLPLDPAQRRVLWEQALTAVSGQISAGAKATETKAAFLALEGSGAYLAYAQGFAAGARGAHREAIAALTRFLQSSSLPERLEAERPNAHLLIARADYALGLYESAANEFARVDPRSAEFPASLSERAWSELQARHYPEAVGATANFQAGRLKAAFAPEAPLVRAMALNELCQYPDSLRATAEFQQNYRDSYFWLKNWAAKTPRAALYPLAVAGLKGEASAGAGAGVPARLLREWLHSPRFLAEQNEIHRLFDEEKQARASLPGAAAPELRAFVARAPELRRQATARINAELAKRSEAMLSQLGFVAENSSLVRVEIFNGASHDMIFRGANPDFRRQSADWRIESKRARASQVLDWGSLRKSGDKVEIWDDEVGSIQASLRDNCTNKKRYLELKRVAKAGEAGPISMVSAR